MELIKDSVDTIPIYNPTYYGNLYYTVSSSCPTNADVTIDPNKVGAYM